MSAPAIRLFQFSGNGVNQFRGDVNLSLNVLSLPSRNGLDVGLTLLYRSNVQDSVERWNLDAPTGVVGLGWSQQVARIEVTAQTSSCLDDARFAIIGDDNPSPLSRSDDRWPLAALELGDVDALRKGEVDLHMREELAAFSIRVSASCRVASDGSDGPWRILDDEEERVYRVTLGTAALEVEDGGLAYEQESFQFWKIRFYPDYQKWLVVRDNGLASVYGGRVSELDGRRVSERNCVQWGVRRGNWFGASALPVGEQYPLAWNLSSIASKWGDRVEYSYQLVEQAVGQGGLPYTKACYPSRVTDVFGRTVAFDYAEKLWGAAPGDAREYMDPHRAVPSDEANAYQDRYETHYLQGVRVLDDEDELLVGLRLAYQVINASGLPSTDPLYGDTCKRVLTEIVQTNAAGESLPGLRFDYYTSSADPHPGALKTVTSPQGGRVTYVFRRVELDLCERSRPITRPTDGDVSAWVPRVWFGADYAVVAWYNLTSGRLRVALFTWLGFWYEWTDAGLDVVAPLQLATLTARTSASAVALSYDDPLGRQTTLHLLHKVAERLGDWRLEAPQVISYLTRRPELFLGDDFLIVVDADRAVLDRWTWSWRWREDVSGSTPWLRDTVDLQALFGASATADYYAAARERYYLVLCYDPDRARNTLKIFHKDGLGAWLPGGTTFPDDITIGGGTGANFFWSLSDTFAVATYVTMGRSSYDEVRVRIFSWDGAYEFTAGFTSGTLRADKGSPFVAVVTGNSLVASGPYLFRYNGREWLTQTVALTIPHQTGNLFWFAAGSDLLLVTQNASTRAISQLAVFDPDVDSAAWTTQPIKLFDGLPPVPHEMYYFPTAAADYLSLDKSFYFRGLSSGWASSVKQPIHQIPAGVLVDTTTIYDQAPSFFSYLELENDGGTLRPLATTILNLMNGLVRDRETFAERIVQVYDARGYPRSDLNGKVPTGPDALVTYLPLAAEWDAAASITLRRSLGAAVDGKVIDRAVVTIVSDDGYQLTSLAYEYDAATAVCDPSGRVVKYYRALTYPGGDPAAHRDGHTETVYINGLPGDVPGVSYPPVSAQNNSAVTYSLLDGFVEAQRTYDADGKLVATETSHWLVKRSRRDPAGKEIPLRGAYVTMGAVDNMLDDVTSRSESVFSEVTGQMIARTTDNWNARGKLETWSETRTYAAEKYPVPAAQNDLMTIVETVSRVEEDGVTSVDKAVVTRMKAWSRPLGGDAPALAVYAPYDTWVWLGGAGQPVFTAWNSDSQPGTDWQRGSSIEAVSDRGLSIEVRDALGRWSSTLHDEKQQLEVAQFANARLLAGEADYLGFESYEQERGWRLAPSGRSWRDLVVAELAHSGDASLRLSSATSGADGLEKVFQPGDQTARYLFACWYRTAADFTQSAQDAGWLVEIRRDGAVLASSFVPFGESAASWSYLSHVIDLGAYAGPGTLEIRLRGQNSTSGDVFLDDLRFSPFVGKFEAAVFDARTRLQMAALGPSQQTLRSVYDDFLRLVAGVGPDENVTALSVQYLSRQGGAVFDRDRPNASISITGRGRGFFADFRRDGGYETHFATGEPTQWAVRGAALVHLGTATGSITLVDPAVIGSLALYLQVAADTPPARPLGITLGGELELRWEPATLVWALKTPGGEETSPAQQALSRELLLCVVGRVVLFFADGERLFSVISDASPTGELSLFAGDPITLSRIVLCTDPQIAVSYADGGGGEKQAQLLHGEESLITETIYDALARPAVASKPARLPPTASCPLLAYRSGFVTGFDWDTGKLTGELDAYYGPDGGGGSDDEGYPYGRTRFEPSPIGRPIEEGLPGRAYAIRDVDTTPMADRHTMRHAYGANPVGGFMASLPGGRYFVKTTTDPDGNVAVTLQDQAGNTVGKGVLTDPLTPTWQTTGYEGLYGDSGKRSITRLPSFFAPPPGMDGDAFQTVGEYDMLGRRTAETTPDSGRAEIISDPAGNSRFTQDAEGRAKGYYRYAKYDAMGRVVEDGVLEGDWDPAALWALAKDDPSWPPTPATWGRKLEYDGDGSDPSQLTQLVAVTTHGALDALTPLVEERLRAGITGDTVEYTLRRLDGTGASYTVSYGYDNQRQVESITYPTSPPLQVRSEYGPASELVAIRTGSDLVAAYEHWATGAIRQETLAAPDGDPILRRYAYSPTGWLRSLDGPGFGQKMYYDEDSDGQPGYFSGLIKEESFDSAVTSGPASYAYRYTYDRAGRLTAAVGASPPSEALLYDMDGNPVRWQDGAVVRDFSYKKGTNELTSTSGGETELAYDANGATIASAPRDITSIAYNRATGRAERVVTGATEVRFGYDGQRRKLLRDQDGASRLYLRGLGADAIVEIDTDADGASSTTVYIHGARSLVAFIRDGRFHRVLADRQGSTRAVVDPTGAIVAGVAYLPYGQLYGVTPAALPLRYLYTGQEWDDTLGLFDFKARFYDPTIGRFLTVDPAGQFASPYSYCAGNPIVFLDPSGEMMLEAGLGIGAGVALAILGTILTVATAGAAAPLAIGGAVLGGAIAGAGTSSVIYSAANSNDWKVRDWGISVGFGALSGAVAGGSGAAAGRAIAAAAARLVINWTTAKAVGVGAAVVAGTVTADAVTNMALTSAYLGISGVTDGKAYKDAAWQVAIGAATGGALAGLGGLGAGIRNGLRTAYRSGPRRFMLDQQSINDIRNLQPTDNAVDGGVCGLLDVNTGNLRAVPTAGQERAAPYGSSHLHVAQQLYGPTAARRTIEGEGLVAEYPALRGWSAARPSGNGNGQDVVVRFGSNSLNRERNPSNQLSRFLEPQHRGAVLVAMRYQANLRNFDVGPAIAETAQAQFLLRLLRSPLS